MKNRNSLKKIKNKVTKHSDMIMIILTIIVGIGIFVSGFTVAKNYLFKPLSAHEIEQCKQIAQTAYETPRLKNIDVPEGFSVVESEQSIKVSTDRSIKLNGSDYVEATLENDELIIKYVRNENHQLVISITFGFLCFLIYILIYLIVLLVYIKIKRVKR